MKTVKDGFYYMNMVYKRCLENRSWMLVL